MSFSFVLVETWIAFLGEVVAMSGMEYPLLFTPSTACHSQAFVFVAFLCQETNHPTTGEA